MALPVSENIACNLVDALKQIDGIGLYNGQVTDVIRVTGNLQNITLDDLLVVVWDYAIKPDEPDKVPIGQEGWGHVFQIDCYIAESKNGDTPIAQRIALALADITRAVMVDKRRGGNLYVDNTIHSVDTTESATDGFYGFRVNLLCKYRTIKGDPNTLAPSGGNEQFFQGQATVFIAPYTSNSQYGPWQRLRDLKVTPVIDPVTDEISSDSHDGLLRVHDVNITGHKIKYTAEADYQNRDILAWRVGATIGDPINVNALTLTAVAHQVQATDSIIPLHDADQNSLLKVSAIQNVKSANGATTYTAESDYIADAKSLSQSTILIPATSTIPAPCVVLIDVTTPALVSRPAFNPTKQTNNKYRTCIIWDSSDGQQTRSGNFDAAIVVTGSTADNAALDTTTFTITVLDDDTDAHCGQLISVAGALPTVGF